MKSIVFAIGLLYWLVTPGYCAAADKSSVTIDHTVHKIGSIEVRGNQHIASERILRQLKTKPGDVFDRERLTSGLQNVSEMGFFINKTLRIIPQMEPGHGVNLTIFVQENPYITGFNFVGNNVFDSSYLNRHFADQVGHPQNFAALSNSIDALQQDYKRIGMSFARVTDVKTSPDGAVEVMICEKRSMQDDHVSHFTVSSATKYFKESRFFLFSGDQPFGSPLLTPYTVPAKMQKKSNVPPVWRNCVDILPAILLPNESDLFMH